MTRDEEIKQASREFGLWKAGEAMFQLGAEWADKHPKEGLVDINRVCEFLEEHSEKYMKFHNDGDSTVFTYDYVELVQDFKKAMGE